MITITDYTKLLHVCVCVCVLFIVSILHGMWQTLPRASLFTSPSHHRLQSHWAECVYRYVLGPGMKSLHYLYTNKPWLAMQEAFPTTDHQLKWLRQSLGVYTDAWVALFKTDVLWDSDATPPWSLTSAWLVLPLKWVNWVLLVQLLSLAPLTVVDKCFSLPYLPPNSPLSLSHKDSYANLKQNLWGV